VDTNIINRINLKELTSPAPKDILTCTTSTINIMVEATNKAEVETSGKIDTGENQCQLKAS